MQGNLRSLLAQKGNPCSHSSFNGSDKLTAFYTETRERKAPCSLWIHLWAKVQTADILDFMGYELKFFTWSTLL